MSNNWIYNSPLGERVANLFDSVEQANNEQGLVDWVKLSGNDGDNDGWVNAVKEHLNIRQYGAKGEGLSNDTLAFQRAVAVGRGFRIPKGRYRLNGTLEPKGALSGSVNLEDYGLIGDGVINDFQALQRAIASGLSVIIPDGIYMLEGDLTLSQAVDLIIELNIDNFGAKGDGVTDDLIAFQKALDSCEGRVVKGSAKVYLISDTLYIPPSVTFEGQGAGDPFNIGGTFPKTVIQLSTTTEGTKRIWTDVGLPATPAGTLVDTPISVGVVATGGVISLKKFTIRSNTDIGDNTNTWDVHFLSAGAFRLNLDRVNTQGTARYCGFLLDATWSVSNTALQDLHTNTYGRTVPSSGSSNEMTFSHCYFQGGQWGIIAQGTKRTDTSPGIWSTGGMSDLTALGCRVSNTPIRLGTQGNGQPIYALDSGGYKRDLHNGFQNRRWIGCGFRATSGCSVYLDSGAYEEFIGVYGESRGDRVPSVEVVKTIDALGVVQKAFTGNYVGNPALVPTEVYIYLTDTTRIDPITNGIKPATIWTTSTGSFTLGAVGYDSTAGRVYLTADIITGTITAGQTVTQAAGQTIGTYGFYATDRAEATYSQGQSSFQAPDKQKISHLGTSGALLGGNFRCAGICSTSEALVLGALDSVTFDCENGSYNIYHNLYGAGTNTFARLRIDDDAIYHYQAANFGQTGRRWGIGYFTSLNVSDTATTRTNLGLGTAAETTYETGTFTPVLQGSTTAGVNTYSVQQGQYVKVGRLVTCMMRLQLSAVGTAGNAMAGDAQISGLPFAISQTPISAVAVNSALNVTGVLGDNYYFQIATGTVIPFNRNSVVATLTTASGVPVTDITNTTQFRINFSYLAAS
jgi:hypothetical protein